MSNIINLTPHTVGLPTGDLPPSGVVARVSRVSETVGHFDGTRLVRGSYGDVTDLPERAEGALYIVSTMVRLACPDRADLASPAELVRDADGRIVGCSALEIN